MWKLDANYTYRIREYNGYTNGKQNIKTVWTCPIYVAWHSMKSRCGKPYQEKYPSYSGVTCCDSWKSFMVFHKWAQESGFEEGLELDKDLLICENKLYSPHTCAFVPKKINYLLNSFKSGKGCTLPMGVTKTSNTTKPFRAYVSVIGKRAHLGVFDNPLDAHKAWQWAKAEQIERAVAWYATQSCFRTDVAEALTARVWKIRLDHTNNRETLKI